MIPCRRTRVIRGLRVILNRILEKVVIFLNTNEGKIVSPGHSLCRT